MAEIRAVPEHLRAVGRQLQEAAAEIRSLEGRGGGALGGLEWEARRKANVDAQVDQVRSRARDLAGRAESLARFLTAVAQAFEDADRKGSGALRGLAATWSRWLSAYKSALPVLEGIQKSRWWTTVEQADWPTRFAMRTELKAQLAREECTDVSPLVRIQELDRQIDDLKQKRAALQRDADNLLNRIIPDAPLQPGGQGGLWRVRADDFADQIGQVDRLIGHAEELRDKYAQYTLVDDWIKQAMGGLAAEAHEYVDSSRWGTGDNTRCLGFVSDLYDQLFGAKVERFNRAIDAAGQWMTERGLGSSTDWGRIPTGTLLFFDRDDWNGGAGHVGIYIGGGRMISVTRGGVGIDAVAESDYWKRLYLGWGEPKWQPPDRR